MAKYNSNTVYKGNIVKKRDTNYKKEVYLIYNEEQDYFYLIDALNYISDLDLNPNLTNEQKEEIQRKIQQTIYSYHENTEDKGYIDEETIQIVIEGKKYQNK